MEQLPQLVTIARGASDASTPERKLAALELLREAAKAKQDAVILELSASQIATALGITLQSAYSRRGHAAIRQEKRR